jgi:flagellar biosynthesis protein FlhG
MPRLRSERQLKMDDFYISSRPLPLDQADGLRKLFASSGKRFMPLAANPHVPFGGIAIERLTAALALLGQHTLIVDAAETSPLPGEAAALDLAACIEPLTPQVSYLAARGLPMRHVNTRGSSARFLEELLTAAPAADVVLVHAGAADLARLFTRRAARTLLLAGDHPESVKHAYASLKLLAQRCGWMRSELLLVASPNSPRLAQIAESLARCADTFVGAVLADWAVVDPAGLASDAPGPDLCRIAAAQLHGDEPVNTGAAPARAHPSAAQARSAPCH